MLRSISRASCFRFVGAKPFGNTYVFQARTFATGYNPTSKYIPATPDRPRYSLKRFNMQLSQSVFCRSPNFERTQLVYRVMRHDGVVGDHVTFYILFNAIKEHQLWELLEGTYQEMKADGVKVDYDIYETLKSIKEISGSQEVQNIMKEIDASGYVHEEKKLDKHASFFFEPVPEIPLI